jgi:uncharacterized protein
MRRILAILVLATVLAAGCGGGGDAPERDEARTVVRIGDATVQVELADDEAARRRGLSGRPRLGRDQGMLFVLPNDMPSFWMKGMRFPLDIVWIDGNRVVDVTADVPPPRRPGGGLPTYSPDRPADRVLEVNAGWAALHGVEPGDTVRVRLPGGSG